MIFRHMWGVKLREYLDLLLYVLDLVLCTLEVDDLYSNGLLCSFVISARRGVKVGSPLSNKENYTHPLYTSPNDPLPAPQDWRRVESAILYA